MKQTRTILIGLGTVNLGFLGILSRKAEEIRTRYGREFIIVGVADSTGIAVKESGFDYAELIQLKKDKKHVRSLDGYLHAALVEDIPDKVKAELLIECSSANLETGQPGLQVARNALRKGVSVVLANKSPLIFAFDELNQLALNHGCSLAYSATVCGGLPVINVLRRDLKLARLIKLHGIFNATSNYILSILENGGSQAEAVKEAQKLGAAEADPSHDIHGYDTANKLFIIMKSFSDFSGTVSDITVEGIQNLGMKQIDVARRNGNKIKLLGMAVRELGLWKLTVKPVEVASGSFLGTCEGWEMGIEITTDLYEKISMKNYEADPLGTSAAVLRDALGASG
jgi:homoserine dehydrogenase